MTTPAELSLQRRSVDQTPTSQRTPIRVAVCQPLMPAYRLPLFEALGGTPGLDVTVFAGGSRGTLPSSDAAKNFRSLRAPVRVRALGAREIKHQPAHFRAISPRAYDVAILSWDAQYVALPFVILLARLLGVAVILWGHGYSKRPRRLTDALRNFVGRCANAVLTYDRTTARQLVERYGFDRRKVFCAQNALDQAPILAAKRHYETNPAALVAFRKTHALDASATVVFVSRLEPDNGIEMLLECARLVRDRFRRLRLVIVGDGPERANLELSSSRLGLSDTVVFTGAIYEERLLAPWMLSATLFCYPRNVGLSLLHAFGYGLPVVTTNNRTVQNPEIDALVDGENGLLYRDGDVHDMARQWVRLLSGPELRSRLSASALRRVGDEFNLQTMLSGFYEAIEYAAARRIGA